MEGDVSHKPAVSLPCHDSDDSYDVRSSQHVSCPRDRSQYQRRPRLAFVGSKERRVDPGKLLVTGNF